MEGGSYDLLQDGKANNHHRLCNISYNRMQSSAAPMMRPEYHFTPPQNFMNDPNGLVFYDGEYHLFYQHNPFGDVWGHMSWGHAVSSDLVHWEHLPVALHEEGGNMIFSGSAVVDWQDTGGFGNDNHPPLIAIYTGYSEVEQNQNLAYSLDRGRTWMKYEGNPILSIGAHDFGTQKCFGINGHSNGLWSPCCQTNIKYNSTARLTSSIGLI